ncbi:MAG: hypothetical protein ACW964_09015 [Candidatus Hodarchaeales archaeon]|jgi:hypothetical protein
MKVLHVQGKQLKEVSPPFEFLNGDVYVIDNSDVSAGLKKKVFIWLGSQAFADDRAVGAWAAKQLDIKDEEIDIDTEIEGQESEEFKGLITFTVVTGDTPGFLKHVEVNKEDVSYALYRIMDTDLTDGSSSDDLVIETVPLVKASLQTGDVFVLDAYQDLFVWVGANSQVGEKAAGNRLVRKLDVDRERNPMVYTINEGYEPKGFFDLISNLTKSDSIRDDAEEISKGIVGGMEDIKSVTPPPEMEKPPLTESIPTPTPVPRATPTPTPVTSTPTPSPQPQPEPTTRDLGLGPSFSISSTPTPAPSSGSVFKLYFVDGEFTEKGGNEEAVLEINEASRTATLVFNEGTGLIAQRTAGRQARGICKGGYLMASGARIGVDCELEEVKGERKIHERLLQVGHEYR